MDFTLKAILVLLATASADFFWTMYITHATENKKWRASIYSSCIILVSSFTVVEYVHDRRLVVPAAIGAFVGTLIPLWRKEKHNAKESKELPSAQ